MLYLRQLFRLNQFDLPFLHGSQHLCCPPGHIPGCISYLRCDHVFSGDALLIGGYGCTDFQGRYAIRQHHA